MRRFYQLLRKSEGLRLEPARAAELEVEWWRAHRENQHGADAGDELIAALTDLYAYTYEAEPAGVRPAAALRAEAMDLSDLFVKALVPETKGRSLEEIEADLHRKTREGEPAGGSGRFERRPAEEGTASRDERTTVR
jgi:hypothetical protein